MPDWQMEVCQCHHVDDAQSADCNGVHVQQVMKSSLGPDWATKFTSFERVPFAAASIGQVHAAVLNASVSPTGKPFSRVTPQSHQTDVTSR